MRGDQQPAADVLHLLAVLLLLVQAAASSAAVDAYGGRVVISYAHHRRAATTATTAEAAALMRRGHLEDEVAPELTSSSGWTAGLRDYIAPNTLIPNRPACIGNCAAKGPGDPYAGCSSYNQCRH